MSDLVEISVSVTLQAFIHIYHSFFHIPARLEPWPGPQAGRTALALALLLTVPQVIEAGAWPVYVVDGSSTGAGRFGLTDLDGDGLADIVAGWTGDGAVRLYLNPGGFRAMKPWPAFVLGRHPAPGDAAFANFGDDETTDVVVMSRKSNEPVRLYRAPARRENDVDPARWRTVPLAASVGRGEWTRAVPREVDFRRGIDLVAGGKGAIGWFEAPADAWDGNAWAWHPVRPSGWITSLIISDMDDDGDADILAADRAGEGAGAFWLENPGPGPKLAGTWVEHPIGATGREVVSLAEADIDGDGRRDVVAAVGRGTLYLFRRLTGSGDAWESHRITLPESSGTVSALSAGDVDLDGRTDLVVLCEPTGDRPAPLAAKELDDATEPPASSVIWPEDPGATGGLFWISYVGSMNGAWEGHPIGEASDASGGSIALVDLDDDRDLDVLTSSGGPGSGITWYDNPTH